MRKIAYYGKGGIGMNSTPHNIVAGLAEMSESYFLVIPKLDIQTQKTSLQNIKFQITIFKK